MVHPHLKPEPQEQIGSHAQPAPLLKRVAWFVFIWLCSVAVLALVAGLIRWAIKT